MLAVRGEKIILQNRDDDFLMEDEAIGLQEVSNKCFCNRFFRAIFLFACIIFKCMISQQIKQVMIHAHVWYQLV